MSVDFEIQITCQAQAYMLVDEKKSPKRHAVIELRKIMLDQTKSVQHCPFVRRAFPSPRATF